MENLNEEEKGFGAYDSKEEYEKNHGLASWGYSVEDQKRMAEDRSIEQQLIDSLNMVNNILRKYIHNLQSNSNEHLIRSMIAPIVEERLEKLVDDALDNLPWDDLINTHLDTSDISSNVVESINDDPEIIEDAVKEVVNNSDFSIHSFELELR
tara:strand:- start:5112 stop:5570 length:459 start_codon:yes stop_codon:yes gene_type:complete